MTPFKIAIAGLGTVGGGVVKALATRGDDLSARAGRKLDSPALVADGQHARVDGFVSLGVLASAAVVALGAPLADPIIGLVITGVILKITWDSWQTIHRRHVEQ